MRKRDDRLRQVMLTYLRRPGLRWSVAVILVIPIFCILSVASFDIAKTIRALGWEYRSLRPFLFLVDPLLRLQFVWPRNSTILFSASLGGSVVAAVLVVWQARQQMFDANARLTPQFVGPGLLAPALFMVFLLATAGIWIGAGAWMLADAGLRPAWCLRVPDLNVLWYGYGPRATTIQYQLEAAHGYAAQGMSLASTSLTVALMVGAWSTVRRRWWIGLILVPVSAFICANSEFVVGFRLAAWIPYDWRHWSPFFIGFDYLDTDQLPWIIAIDVVGLIGLGWLWARMAGRDEPLKIPFARPAAIAMAWIDSTFQVRKSRGSIMQSGVWNRARHRRRIGIDQRAVWIIGGLTTIFMATLPFWLRTDHNSELFSRLSTAAIAPALVICLVWLGRRSSLAYESLRPATRVAFVRETGLAVLADLAELTLATVLAVLIGTVIWTPTMLSRVQLWTSLGALGLTQVLVFGILAEAIRSRSTAALPLATIFLICASELLVVRAWNGAPMSEGLIAAIIGVILAAHAYWRWCEADLA